MSGNVPNAQEAPQPWRRQAIQLRAEIRMAGRCWPVLIGNLPGTAGVMYIDQTPPPGEDAELWVENFGSVGVDLVHSAGLFCGCAISNPAVNRDRLMLWLRNALKADSASPQERSASFFLCAAKEQRKENLRPR